MNVKENIVNDINRTAEHVLKTGGKVDINNMLPTVFLLCPDGSEYFFQDHEADELLKDVPDNVIPENYLLWVSQGW